MNKRIKSILATLAVITILTTGYGVRAEGLNSQLIDNKEVEAIVTEALSEKTFYKYNVAYTEIVKLTDDSVKNQLLGKLGTIADIVWSDDVKKFNKMLDELVKTGGSGKIYDQMEAQVNTSTLPEVDKAYLLGELTSWGKKLVYTTDYAAAVEKIIKAWNAYISKDTNIETIIAEADESVALVINSESRTYLSEQLQQIRDEVSPVKEGLVLDEELTNKLSKPGVDYMYKRGDNCKVELLIQSAINISQGKDVVPEIKEKWDPKSKSDVDDRAQFVDFSHVTFNSKDPKNEYRLAGKTAPVPGEYYNFAVFEYTVVYWNSDIEMYEVHNIKIGI